jgi:glycosyltransferase involved in cell wall biosynthesis
MNHSEENIINNFPNESHHNDAFKASTPSEAFNAFFHKKVLIITYYWPPSGGAGVQRWLKFSKYLPEFGWMPVILTVDPQYAAYPVTDNSLIDDLPETVKVHTTRATNYFSIYKKDKSAIPSAGFANNNDNSFKSRALRFVRGNFFLPDPRRGWNKFAYRKACELIESEGIECIVTTSPPHSTQLIGLKLKKKFKSIRWVADLRDPWTDIYYYKQFYPTILSRSIDSSFEKKVLKNADKIITVGASLKKLFSSKLDGLDEKTEVITNGYDESDFRDIYSVRPSRFTVTYVGTLSDIYPVEALIPALNSLKEKDFLLRFVGTVSEKTAALLKSGLPEKSLEFLPYVIHSEAVKYMVNSSLLLLIIPLHQSNKSIITGKLFEYLASGVPILCLGPVDGDAAVIIKNCKSGKTFSYYDVDRISEFIKSACNNPIASDSNAVSAYSRGNLVKRIAEVLEQK